MTERTQNRREFLGTAAAAGMLPLMVHGAVGEEKKDDFRVAIVGCSGRGGGNLNDVVKAGAKVVALCDVDPGRGEKAAKEHPHAARFTDYRKMLDAKAGEIDGVVVSTPDHTHAVVALASMQRGKHVYVEKPLARTYDECQVLLEAARKYGVATQMGNQGHAGAGLKKWQAMMDGGAFGEIAQVHTWSDRPIWPQGMTKLPESKPIPTGFDWDAWLGPVAQRGFSDAYLPFKWRGWWDFGCGAMGDMACHNMDPAFWTLALGAPTSIKATASAPATLAYPAWSVIEYTFAPSKYCPAGLKLWWHDGKKVPEAPAGVAKDWKAGSNGCMIIGSRLTAMGGSHASPPSVIAVAGKQNGEGAKEANEHWASQTKGLGGDHHHGQWIKAAQARDPKQTGSKFEYAAPMTQTILLGCIALRFPGQELTWDDTAKQFTNLKEANEWLKITPRSGFSLG